MASGCLRRNAEDLHTRESDDASTRVQRAAAAGAHAARARSFKQTNKQTDLLDCPYSFVCLFVCSHEPCRATRARGRAACELRFGLTSPFCGVGRARCRAVVRGSASGRLAQMSRAGTSDRDRWREIRYASLTQEERVLSSISMYFTQRKVRRPGDWSDADRTATQRCTHGAAAFRVSTPARPSRGREASWPLEKISQVMAMLPRVSLLLIQVIREEAGER